MTRGRRTPPNIIARIDELLLSGILPEEIPELIRKELGALISRSPVDRRAEALGLSNPQGRPAAADVRSRIADLRDRGFKPAAIADELGMRRPNVYRYLRSLEEENKKEPG